jgi:hypothetical protein
MGQADPTEFPVSKLKAGLLGVIGTAVGSFVPGVLASAVLLFVFGPGKLDHVSELMVSIRIFALLTAAAAAGYVLGLLPLFCVARVKQASHAFWLAAAAGLCSVVAFMAGVSLSIADRLYFATQSATQSELVLPAVVAVLHLVLFSILCLLYRQLARRGPREDGGIVASHERG